MAELFGKGHKIDAAQKTLRESAGILEAESAERFGRAVDLPGPAAENISERMNEAGRNIGRRFSETFAMTPEAIKTDGLRRGGSGVVADIRQSMPNPKERDIKAGLAPQDSGEEEERTDGAAQRMAPLVTSLGNVGRGESALMFCGILTPADFPTGFQHHEEQSRQLEAAQAQPLGGIGGKKPRPATNQAS